MVIEKMSCEVWILCKNVDTVKCENCWRTNKFNKVLPDNFEANKPRIKLRVQKE